MSKNRKKQKIKQQPDVSIVSVRPVNETDTWCVFKKPCVNQKAIWGYVVSMKRPSSTRKLQEILKDEMIYGHIIRSKLIKNVFYVQIIVPDSFYGPVTEYNIFSKSIDVSKNRKRRIINVQNTNRPKRVKRTRKQK